MSDSNKDFKFTLRAMVNKESKKFLFADVDSSFADVLLSFLTLPLGTIVRILKSHYKDEPPAFGSLTTLYNGIANLDSVYFWTEDAKSILLHPRSSSDASRKKLKLDVSDSPPLEYFICDKNCTSTWFPNGSIYYDTVSACKFSKSHSMKRKIDVTQTDPCNDGVFTINTSSFVSFVITDDLRIVPTSSGLLQIVNFLGIADVDKAEQVDVTFGYAEVMSLLKASLVSSTPLSDVIFGKTGQMKSTALKLQHRTLSYEIKNASSFKSNKMVLRVFAQRSTDKVLYAQAGEDFVELLFGFLVLPLGAVVRILERSSLNKCFDLLYMSVADHIDNKYLKIGPKKMLTNPKIPHGYVSENYVLPLAEEVLTDFHQDMLESFSSEKFPNGQGKYLKAPRTYMVKDDLTVTPLCIASALSYLNGMKIPISDVKEVELQIGLKEALDILRASLTSDSALSNGLNLTNHKSQKQKDKDYQVKSQFDL
ncbi:hypothetical protein AAHA92_10976 [Salvia divinorum]|uniref:DUF674 family protein n=1 Tax=Salvia divinorum TaxID=28513 RepID=A0ABD1HYA3_SALDI